MLPVFRKFRVGNLRAKHAPEVTITTGSARRLFIDLAVVSRHDAGTGIQRVVRSLALALVEQGGVEWDIRFVSADRRSSYHTIAWPDVARIVSREQMKARPGDVFLGLDFSLDTIRRYRRQLAQFRKTGGQLWFLICDVLPIDFPEWFSPNNVVRYKSWLNTIAGLADGFLCISHQTENDLVRVLETRYGISKGYQTCILEMGHDLRKSLVDTDATDMQDNTTRFDLKVPFSLMVGTLEPRKGHADIISAFSDLWGRGSNHRLVLVGRSGWKVEWLCQLIRSHPEHLDKLLWFDDVDDSELENMYKACKGVIIASHAEGFGLPLIEALGHGKPVLARDIAIFRIHEELGVRYFPEKAARQELASRIDAWIQEVASNQIHVRRPGGSWASSARTCLATFSISSDLNPVLRFQGAAS